MFSSKKNKPPIDANEQTQQQLSENSDAIAAIAATKSYCIKLFQQINAPVAQNGTSFANPFEWENFKNENLTIKKKCFYSINFATAFEARKFADYITNYLAPTQNTPAIPLNILCKVKTSFIKNTNKVRLPIHQVLHALDQLDQQEKLQRSPRQPLHTQRVLKKENIADPEKYCLNLLKLLQIKIIDCQQLQLQDNGYVSIKFRSYEEAAECSRTLEEENPRFCKITKSKFGCHDAEFPMFLLYAKLCSRDEGMRDFSRPASPTLNQLPSAPSAPSAPSPR